MSGNVETSAQDIPTKNLSHFILTPLKNRKHVLIILYWLF